MLSIRYRCLNCCLIRKFDEVDIQYKDIVDSVGLKDKKKFICCVCGLKMYLRKAIVEIIVKSEIKSKL